MVDNGRATEIADAGDGTASASSLRARTSALRPAANLGAQRGLGRRPRLPQSGHRRRARSARPARPSRSRTRRSESRWRGCCFSTSRRSSTRRAVEVHVSGIGWAGRLRRASRLRRPSSATFAAPSGTAMAIRAETFRELGGFAEELFMYLEDLELGWRARLAGYRVVVDPGCGRLARVRVRAQPAQELLPRAQSPRLRASLRTRPRLLVLLAPLLVSTELGMTAIATQGGMVAGQGRRAGAGCCATARSSRRRRRATQALRRVRDRELARLPDRDVLAGDAPVPGLLRAANPVVAAYWRLVRRAL